MRRPRFDVRDEAVLPGGRGSPHVEPRSRTRATEGSDSMPARTMFEKIWDAHLVKEEPGKPALIYIDLHLVHEVTSPQAFEGLRLAERAVRRPDLTIATADHNVPTTDRSLPIEDEISRL